MISLLRIFRLLLIVVWVGGLIFFAFVVAPVSFHVLPSTHEAGTVVAGTLSVLNHMGLICAPLFIAATGMLYIARPHSQRALASAPIFLALGMMVATMYVQWSIVPKMERDRIAAGGDVDAAAPDNPARLDFERLHPLSEKVEGAGLFLGLAIIVLMGLERTA
jgi:uncharacterized membrane protein